MHCDRSKLVKVRWTLAAPALYVFVMLFVAFGIAPAEASSKRCTSKDFKRVDGGDMSFCAAEDYIFAKGIINEGASFELAQILQEFPQTRTIFLQSGGGLAAEGAQMGELVRRLGLHTATNGICASACVLVYLGGVERHKTKKAKLGFHRAAAVAEISEQEREELITDMLPQLKQYFAAMGADGQALDPAWKRSIFSMYWYSAKELKKWNIATHFGAKSPSPPKQANVIEHGATIGAKLPCAMMGDFVKEWNRRNSKKWLDSATQSKWATVNCKENRVRFRYYLKAPKYRLSKRSQAKSAREVYCDDGFLREQMKLGWQVWFHVDFRDKKSRAIIVNCNK